MARPEAHKNNESIDFHLEYSFKHIDHILVASLSGEADMIGSARLRDAIINELNGVERIIFDLGELSFADSHFLRLLLKLRKHLGGVSTVKVRNARVSVKRVFEVTGLHKLFM